MLIIKRDPDQKNKRSDHNSAEDAFFSSGHWWLASRGRGAWDCVIDRGGTAVGSAVRGGTVVELVDGVKGETGQHRGR